MKKFTYYLLLLLVFGSCKFAETPYSFEREFQGGTYITPEGIVKYISGAPDSAMTISDNYAIIKQEITYHKAGAKQTDGTTIHLDSILIYGHCFSLEKPDARAVEEGLEITMDRLLENSVIYYNGSSEPTSFISITDLGKGITFESSLGLQYEKEYYIRSFVVTGGFKNGVVYYDDIAYNQYELQIFTKTPVDLWVGGTMQNAPEDFLNSSYWGATSFTYNGKLYVAQGHNESGFGSTMSIYEFDPGGSPQWNLKYTQPISPAEANFTNAISFVIEDVEINQGTSHDCAFIGTGLKYDGTASKRFYRLDFVTGEIKLVAPDVSTVLVQAFPGNARHNAVAFSINGIGYVGLGTLGNGTVMRDFYKYDPNDRSAGYDHGKWTKIDNFLGVADGDPDPNKATRTKASIFQIGEYVYLSGGEDNNGTMKNDLWQCRQTSTENLIWVQRAPFPGTPRVDAVGFNIGENGYIGTGLDIDSARSDFYRYDPRLNAWEQKAYFSGLARYEAVGAGIKISENDYRGYIGTGWAGIASVDYNDFWHYRP